MHQPAYDAVARLLSGVPTEGARVLEIGAFDVNGSARPLLSGAAEVVGLDVRPGRGVDIVADAATYEADQPFDVIISTETLEHAPDPRGIVARCYANLRPGGWLVVTAAGPERAPHNCNGGPTIPPDEHYANISPQDLEAWLAGWANVTIEHNPQAGDVYAKAQRPPDAPPTRRSKKAA